MELKSVFDGVLDYLRNRIVVQDLQPGQKLNEFKLASELDISRPPLREALRALENENLVTYIPRKGTCVTDLSLQDCIETYRVRKMMECYAIDLLSHMHVRDVSHLDPYLDDGAVKPGDESSPEEKINYFKATVDFHVQLVDSAKNARLSNLYRRIIYTVYRYQYLQWSAVSKTRKISLGEHKQVRDAITKGSYTTAKRFLCNHINHAFDMVSESYMRYFSESKSKEEYKEMVASFKNDSFD